MLRSRIRRGYEHQPHRSVVLDDPTCLPNPPSPLYVVRQRINIGIKIACSQHRQLLEHDDRINIGIKPLGEPSLTKHQTVLSDGRRGATTVEPPSSKMQCIGMHMGVHRRARMHVHASILDWAVLCSSTMRILSCPPLSRQAGTGFAVKSGTGFASRDSR